MKFSPLAQTVIKDKLIQREQTRPIIESVLIKNPKTEKHLIQIFGTKIRATAIITEIIIKGSKFIKRSSAPIPHVIPATKQPIGIVIMPQSKPKNISLCFSFFIIPRAKGIVNEITHPIIEDTIKAL